MPDYFDKLYHNVDGYNRRFPEGDTPFRMMSRLCEEAGELAKAVNHFEGTGIKRQKYGEPDRMVLAKEVQDVIRTAMCVVRYYEIEHELERSIDETYQRLRDGGYIEEDSRE